MFEVAAEDWKNFLKWRKKELKKNGFMLITIFKDKGYENLDLLNASVWKSILEKYNISEVREFLIMNAY